MMGETYFESLSGKKQYSKHFINSVNVMYGKGFFDMSTFNIGFCK